MAAINTILSVVGVNMKTLKPLPTVEGYSVPGGYSFLGAKPIGLRMVKEIAESQPALSISGIGGVATARDAFEFVLMGASTVQVCTAAMLQGLNIIKDLKTGLEAYLDEHGFEKLEHAVGHSLQYFTTHHDLVSRQAAKRKEKARARASRDLAWGEMDLAATTSAMTSTESSSS